MKHEAYVVTRRRSESDSIEIGFDEVERGSQAGQRQIAILKLELTGARCC